MGKKPTTNEPSPVPMLKRSREEATAALLEQKRIGEVIRDRRIGTDAEIVR